MLRTVTGTRRWFDRTQIFNKILKNIIYLLSCPSYHHQPELLAGRGVLHGGLMFGSDPENRSMSILSRGLFAGALLAVAVMLLVNHLNDQALTVSTIWLPVLLGGVAVLLAGLGAWRLRGTAGRTPETEQPLEKFFQSTPALLHSIDSSGHLLNVSQAWLDLLGYDRELPG